MGDVFCDCGHAWAVHDPKDLTLCKGCGGTCDVAHGKHHDVYGDHY